MKEKVTKKNFTQNCVLLLSLKRVYRSQVSERKNEVFPKSFFFWFFSFFQKRKEHRGELS